MRWIANQNKAIRIIVRSWARNRGLWGVALVVLVALAAPALASKLVQPPPLPRPHPQTLPPDEAEKPGPVVRPPQLPAPVPIKTVATGVESSTQQRPSVPAGPTVTARAAVVMDAKTGTVLYALRPHERRAPASLTKIVSALVVVERADLDAVAKVSAEAARRPETKLGLHFGDRIPVSKLLSAMLMGSSNDAATAAAEHISGSEAAFAKLMNEKAKVLGAGESHFVNPHGLDAPGHYSTAFDLAIVSRALLQNTYLADIVSDPRAYISWQGGEKEVLNGNSFLWRYEGAIGVKTGYTSEAGYSAAAAATHGQRSLIVVLLGCPTSDDRWADAAALMNYGMNNFTALMAAAKENTKTYVVRPGDTLYGIAHRFGKKMNELLIANPWLQKNPDRLYEGQRLQIP